MRKLADINQISTLLQTAHKNGFTFKGKEITDETFSTLWSALFPPNSGKPIITEKQYKYFLHLIFSKQFQKLENILEEIVKK